jgi:hypothetical protein
VARYVRKTRRRPDLVDDAASYLAKLSAEKRDRLIRATDQPADDRRRRLAAQHGTAAR